MKILYLQDKFGTGGINKITSVKENYLVDKGFDIHNLNVLDKECVPRKGVYSDMFQRLWCQCREWLHALPKIMFDRYFQIGGDIFQRLGHFLWKGMKPFPAHGTCTINAMDMYVMIPPSSVGASAGVCRSLRS